MRLTRRHTALAVCATLTLTACSAATDTDAPTSPPPASPTDTPTAAPGSPAPPPPERRTDVAAADLLPADAWGPQASPREESTEVTAWRTPQSCETGTPADAVAMLTATHGDGQEEAPVGVQQVAVLPDADTAVSEAARLGDALTACTDAGESAPTLYVAEPLDIGAQGLGLATDHDGSSAGGDLDGALGTYLAVTRRGNAVTLVTLDGGESTVGAARERVTSLTSAAWELLCGYDTQGC